MDDRHFMMNSLASEVAQFAKKNSRARLATMHVLNEMNERNAEKITSWQKKCESNKRNI
jgi:hypothetical protein